MKIQVEDNVVSRSRFLSACCSAVARLVHARFCSVAYDTDKFFGSEGNFFQSEYQQVRQSPGLPTIDNI